MEFIKKIEKYLEDNYGLKNPEDFQKHTKTLLCKTIRFDSLEVLHEQLKAVKQTQEKFNEDPTKYAELEKEKQQITEKIQRRVEKNNSQNKNKDSFDIEKIDQMTKNIKVEINQNDIDLNQNTIKSKEIIALKPDTIKNKEKIKSRITDINISRGPMSDRKVKLDQSLDFGKSSDQSPGNVTQKIHKLIETSTCRQDTPVNQDLISIDVNTKNEPITLNKKKKPSYTESTNVSNKNQIVTNNPVNQKPSRMSSQNKNNEKLQPVNQLASYDFNTSKTRTNNDSFNSNNISINIDTVQTHHNSVDKYDKARNQIKKLVNRNSVTRPNPKQPGLYNDVADENQVRTLNSSLDNIEKRKSQKNNDFTKKRLENTVEANNNNLNIINSNNTSLQHNNELNNSRMSNNYNSKEINKKHNDEYNNVKKRIVRKMSNSQNPSIPHEENQPKNKEKQISYNQRDSKDKYNPYLKNNKINTYNFENNASNKHRDLETSKNSYAPGEFSSNTDREKNMTKKQGANDHFSTLDTQNKNRRTLQSYHYKERNSQVKRSSDQDTYKNRNSSNQSFTRNSIDKNRQSNNISINHPSNVNQSKNDMFVGGSSVVGNSQVSNSKFTMPKEDFRVNSKYERPQRSSSINNSLQSSNRVSKVINSINGKINTLNASSNQDNQVYTLIGEEINIENNPQSETSVANSIVKPLDLPKNPNPKSSVKNCNRMKELSQTIKDSTSVIEAYDPNLASYNILHTTKNQPNLYQTDESSKSKDDLINTPQYDIKLK